MDDRIDKYIQGHMEPEERNKFEQELASDPKLKEELQSIKNVAEGIQRNALKNELSNIESLRKRRHLNWQRAACYLAIAACLCGIILDVNISSTYSRLKTFGSAMYTSLDEPLSRSANQVDNLLQEAYGSIGEGEFYIAEAKLEEINKSINEGLQTTYEIDEITEYEHSLLLIQQQDAEWYSAIIEMKQGHIKKARKLLKEIASKGGVYADEAKAILDKSPLL